MNGGAWGRRDCIAVALEGADSHAAVAIEAADETTVAGINNGGASHAGSAKAADRGGIGGSKFPGRHGRAGGAAANVPGLRMVALAEALRLGPLRMCLVGVICDAGWLVGASYRIGGGLKGRLLRARVATTTQDYI